ncbi:unnamed protein product [Parnassius apollo]|uniref:(apollo) hypothetical protein n=1 Tax=Parnassius apollo TaxID=110799 RepID=A0A8S3XTC5_PARAO|nr:unnamed protein product [Parnassius apollo]
MPYLDISVTEVIEHMSNEPIAGSSGIQKDVNDFLVETVRPLPKAPPRVPSNRKRARKSAILTDTPEKIALEEEHHIKELKKRKMTEKNQNKENKKNKKKGQGKGKRKIEGDRKISKDEKIQEVKKKILIETSDSDEDKYFCIICGISYNEDQSGGDWIQCISCKDWAQAGCIKGDVTSFICLNCNSDDDEYE